MDIESGRVFLLISLSLLNVIFLIDGSTWGTLQEIWKESWNFQDIYLQSFMPEITNKKYEFIIKYSEESDRVLGASEQ